MHILNSPAVFVPCRPAADVTVHSLAHLPSARPVVLSLIFYLLGLFRTQPLLQP